MAIAPPSRFTSRITTRPARSPHRFRALLVVLLCVVLRAAPAPTEYEVKAAFLLNFTKFTEWPASAFPSADSPLAICIIGDDPFGDFLDNIVQGETVDGRKVVARRAPAAPAAGLCQLAYVNVPAPEFPRTLAALKPGVLTVGEGERFVRDGGIIGFVLDNKHVRFLVNPSAAESAGLKLSSRLLTVAKEIEK